MSSARLRTLRSRQAPVWPFWPHLEEESRTGWRWLPFLARLLSVIQSKEVFQPHPDGDQEPGVRCVEKVVRDIISIEWNHDLVTGMCSVLKVNISNS